MTQSVRLLLNFILQREHLFYELKIFYLQALSNLAVPNLVDVQKYAAQIKDIEQLLQLEETEVSIKLLKTIKQVYTRQDITQFYGDAIKLVELTQRRFSSFFPLNGQACLTEHQRFISQLMACQANTSGLTQFLHITKFRLQNEAKRIMSQMTMNYIFQNLKYTEKGNLKYYQAPRTVETFRYIIKLYRNYFSNTQSGTMLTHVTLYSDIMQDLDTKSITQFAQLPYQCSEAPETTNDIKVMQHIEALLDGDRRIREIKMRNQGIRSTTMNYYSATHPQQDIKLNFSPRQVEECESQRITTPTNNLKEKRLEKNKQRFFHYATNGKDFHDSNKNQILEATPTVSRKQFNSQRSLKVLSKKSPMSINVISIENSHPVKFVIAPESAVPFFAPKVTRSNYQHFLQNNRSPAPSHEIKLETQHSDIQTKVNSQSYLFGKVRSNPLAPEKRRPKKLTSVELKSEFLDMLTTPKSHSNNSKEDFLRVYASQILKNRNEVQCPQNEHIQAFFRQYFRPVTKQTLAKSIDRQYRQVESRIEPRRRSNQVRLKEAMLSYHGSQMSIFN